MAWNKNDLLKIKFIGFDFDGVFTDNSVYVSADGREIIRCYRSDGLGIKRIKELGIKTAVISSEPDNVVQARCEKLKLECYHGVQDKLTILKQIVSEYQISMEQVAFMGNDINDLSVMAQVGFPIAVADAYPQVKQAAFWITKTPGGYGAVREICDLLHASHVKG
jgi:3-deoxy-D-manno-octulosonate 8-phosphate phosphatase (KDO 8-P phosphatase)